MTTKEAIKWFDTQLLCNQTKLTSAYFKEPFEKAIEALKIAERFEGAVEAKEEWSDWDWDVSCWVYSSQYVYDKHNNKRLISDLRAEFDRKIYNNEIKLYDIPKEQSNDQPRST